MTGIERRAWLALLKAEFARRAARVEWQAGEDERAAQQVVEELRQMAGRFAATAHLYPLLIDDMAPMEMLACRYFLPEHVMPAGLPTEAQIWADFQTSRPGAELDIGPAQAS
jgi:hypothetical protein